MLSEMAFQCFAPLYLIERCKNEVRKYGIKYWFNFKELRVEQECTQETRVKKDSNFKGSFLLENLCMNFAIAYETNFGNCKIFKLV